MSLKIKHNWQCEADILPEVDSTNIPGLALSKEKGKVFGTIDAISVYYRRGNQRIPKPKNGFKIINDTRLRSFQKEGVAFILNNWNHSGSALLTDEMGLGKTLQAIDAADRNGASRILVVCPRSVALTWKREVGKWSTGTVGIMKTREECSRLHGSSHRWTIISYDLLQFLHPSIFDVVIIDEAHNFSGRTAKRGKALRQICAMAGARLALTGTEIWSRPRDYWMLFSCLFGTAFGNRWNFDHAYCDAQENEHGGLDNTGASRLDELKHRVRFYRLRRLKRDVAKELPACTREIRWIDADKKATALMKAAFLHRNRGAYAKALAATLDAKMEAAIDAASSAKRFLLFTWTKRHAASMYRSLNENGTPCFLLTGDVSAKKRNTLIALAAKKKYGIVATLDTLKEGVDGLQHVANIGIFHALDFVGLKLLQGEARLDRIGQTMPVQWIYILMKESMDAWINEIVISKFQNFDTLAGDPKSRRMREQLLGRKANEERTEEQLERDVFKQIYKAQKRKVT